MAQGEQFGNEANQVWTAEIGQDELRHEATAARQAKFLLEVIATEIEPERLLQDYKSILVQNEMRGVSHSGGLCALSLTHRPEADEPLYDGNNSQYSTQNNSLRDVQTHQKRFYERDFSLFNPKFEGTVFHEVYERMPFRIGRMQLNVISPLTVFRMHVDSTPTADLVVSADPNCYMMSADTGAYPLRADGNVYVFDTQQPHTAVNASTAELVEVTFTLADHEVDPAPRRELVSSK
ncbi:MAG TPA: hypothetical protein VK694_04565 [Verrucomicrobiae bacterium]|nr:hypothetical protein [Verrucomicrobiae bacterium]